MFIEGEIDGLIIKKMTAYTDDRGWLMELFRIDEAADFVPAMSYISLTHSGVVRGPHEHKAQTDYFCFLGQFSLFLWDNREFSPTYRHKKVIENADRLIVIVPPGIVHAYKNIDSNDAMVLNFPDRLYAGWNKKERVDEIRYENDPECPFKIK